MPSETPVVTQECHGRICWGLGTVSAFLRNNGNKGKCCGFFFFPVAFATSSQESLSPHFQKHCWFLRLQFSELPQEVWTLYDDSFRYQKHFLAGRLGCQPPEGKHRHSLEKRCCSCTAPSDWTVKSSLPVWLFYCAAPVCSCSVIIHFYFLDFLVQSTPGNLRCISYGNHECRTWRCSHPIIWQVADVCFPFHGS